MGAALISGKSDGVLVHERDLQLLEKCGDVALRIADSIGTIGARYLPTLVNVVNAFAADNFAALRAVKICLIVASVRMCARNRLIDEPGGKCRICFDNDRVIALFAGFEPAGF